MNKQNEFHIPLDKLKKVTCSICHKENFIIIYQICKLPALMSPSGFDQFIKIEMFQCIECNNVFIPGKDEKKTISKGN